MVWLLPSLHQEDFVVIFCFSFHHYLQNQIALCDSLKDLVTLFVVYFFVSTSAAIMGNSNIN